MTAAGTTVGSATGRWRRGVAWIALAAVVLGTVPALRAADTVPDAVLEAEQQRIEAIAGATRAAVAVFEPGGSGGGSAVVVTPDGYALTNYHVVAPCGAWMQCGMADGQLYDAVLVGVDPTGDVALIKLLGRDDFPYVPLGDSDTVEVGQWCFAVGNPFLLATDFQPTVTYGIVSGVERYQYPAGTLLEYTDCIQTDAAINPGNSGGPLFNEHGELIGINGRGSFEKRGRVNVGVGYAISINQVKNFLGHLRSGRVVDHATLGATVSSDGQGRVIVTNIRPTSDAYRRGLRYGDELIAFGGRSIQTVNAFKNVLGVFPNGWRVPLSFRRNNQRHDVLVRLMGLHAPEELLAKMERQLPMRPHRPDEPDEGQPPDRPRVPRGDGPRPPAAAPARATIPEHVQPLIEQRTGYANYYFNRLERDRVWQQMLQHGDFATASGPWRLTGTNQQSAVVRVMLDRDQSVGYFDGETASIESGDEWHEQQGPPESSGLLLALHVWRKLLTEGVANFGEVYYLGNAPLAGHSGLFDVLVATYGLLEAHLYVEPDSGYLVAIELFGDVDVDPCELHFSEYVEVAGCKVPQRIEVRYGSEVVTRVEWDQVLISELAEG